MKFTFASNILIVSGLWMISVGLFNPFIANVVAINMFAFLHAVLMIRYKMDFPTYQVFKSSGKESYYYQEVIGNTGFYLLALIAGICILPKEYWVLYTSLVLITIFINGGLMIKSVLSAKK